MRPAALTLRPTSLAVIFFSFLGRIWSLHAAASSSISQHASAIASTLGRSSTSVAVVDGFLGTAACRAMRAEAEALRSRGWLEVAPSSGDVRSTQQLDEDVTPEMSAFAGAVAREVASALSLPLAEGEDAYSTKLAVAESNGAAYQRHIDTDFSGTDPRKVTLIYYLNPDWDESQGGSLRAFSDNDGDQPLTEIEPRGDRVVAFWSDSCVLHPHPHIPHTPHPLPLPYSSILLLLSCHTPLSLHHTPRLSHFPQSINITPSDARVCVGTTT